MKSGMLLGSIVRTIGVVVILGIIGVLPLGMGLLIETIIHPNINMITGKMPCEGNSARTRTRTCIYNGCNLENGVFGCYALGTVGILSIFGFVLLIVCSWLPISYIVNKCNKEGRSEDEEISLIKTRIINYDT